MNIYIYINGRPVESYTEEELQEIKKNLTYTAMKAAGYVPVEQEGETDECKTTE